MIKPYKNLRAVFLALTPLAACVNELPVDLPVITELDIVAEFTDSDTTMVGKIDTLRLFITRDGVPLTGVRTRWISPDTTVVKVRKLSSVLPPDATTEDSLAATMTGEVEYLERGFAWFDILIDSVDIDDVLEGSVVIDNVQERWGEVTAGNGHTCAATFFDPIDELRGGGETFCWGTGTYGALGSGSLDQRSFPGNVAANEAFFQVQAGERFTCARTDETGLLFCWGDNSSGQLGNGNDLDQFVPRLTAVGENYLDFGVSKADLFTCAVSFTRLDELGLPARPGFTNCWGQNDMGQLGCGVDAACDPNRLLTPNTLSPQRVVDSVETDLIFETVSVGGSHACGIQDQTFIAWCWGANDFGQLGIDPVTPMSRFAQPVQTQTPFAFIDAGRDFTCGVDFGSVVHCWGRGLGGLPDTNVPTIVDGLPGQILISLTTGGEHACALYEFGEMYCWGDNFFGQLGDGNEGQTSPTPVLVLGNHSFESVSAGAAHTCAVRREPLDTNGGGFAAGGALFCWGDNSVGQLGNGTAGGVSPIPVRVIEPFS